MAALASKARGRNGQAATHNGFMPPQPTRRQFVLHYPFASRVPWRWIMLLVVGFGLGLDLHRNFARQSEAYNPHLFAIGRRASCACLRRDRCSALPPPRAARGLAARLKRGSRSFPTQFRAEGSEQRAIGFLEAQAISSCGATATAASLTSRCLLRARKSRTRDIYGGAAYAGHSRARRGGDPS